MSVTKPGMSSSTPAKQDHHPVGKLAARIAAGVHLLADTRHHAETLDAQKDRAENAGRHDQRQRRQHADLAPDDHEAGDLEEGQREKEERDDGNRIGFGTSRMVDKGGRRLGTTFCQRDNARHRWRFPC